MVTIALASLLIGGTILGRGGIFVRAVGMVLGSFIFRLVYTVALRFNDLVLEDQLWTYLADLNEQAQERLSLIVEQMKAAEGVTEELKATDQMAWIGAMNSICNRSEEIVLKEIVYR